jgi:hypothetical protein
MSYGTCRSKLAARCALRSYDQSMRYAMRLDPIWRPLLLIGGAHAANSYAQIAGGSVRFRFGALFDETVPLRDIQSAERTSWPLIFGIGWRTSFGRLVGLIGSQRDVVQVRLRDRREMHLRILPWAMRIDDLRISIEDPDGFIEALSSAIAGQASN